MLLQMTRNLKLTECLLLEFSMSRFGTMVDWRQLRMQIAHFYIALDLK